MSHFVPSLDTTARNQGRGESLADEVPSAALDCTDLILTRGQMTPGRRRELSDPEDEEFRARWWPILSEDWGSVSE